MSDEETRLMPALARFERAPGELGSDKDLNTPLVGVGFVGDTHFGDTHFGSAVGTARRRDETEPNQAMSAEQPRPSASQGAGPLSGGPAREAPRAAPASCVPSPELAEKRVEVPILRALSAATKLCESFRDASAKWPLRPGLLLLGGLIGGGVGVLAAGYPPARGEAPAASLVPPPPRRGAAVKSEVTAGSSVVAELPGAQPPLAAEPSPAAAPPLAAEPSPAAEASQVSPAVALRQVLSGECAEAAQTYIRLADRARDNQAEAEKWRAFSKSVRRTCAELVPSLLKSAAKDGER